MSGKKEHPILMCGEMVRAILAGAKTETRRMAGLKEINERPDCWNIAGDAFGPTLGIYCLENDVYSRRVLKSPYGHPGGTLWVRENWAFSHSGDHLPPRLCYKANGIFHYCATENIGGLIKRPSIHMPRWASRITLTVKGVTLERLHEITDEGARGEGVKDRAEYESLWKRLNGEESWSLNPWVWVVKFDVKEIKK